MPELTHRSVQQLLQVLHHTARIYRQGTPLPTAYQEAIRDVSNRHKVTYQTIGDLCRRRLGLRDISQFVHLLETWLGGNPDSLRGQVKRQSAPSAHSEIDRFFADGTLNSSIPTASSLATPDALPLARLQHPVGPSSERLALEIPAETARRLRLAHVAGLGATLEETAIVLLAKGFEVERDRIRQFLDNAVGPA